MCNSRFRIKIMRVGFFHERIFTNKFPGGIRQRKLHLLTAVSVKFGEAVYKFITKGLLQLQTATSYEYALKDMEGDPGGGIIVDMYAVAPLLMDK